MSFSVEIAGETVYDFGPCRRGDPAVPVHVDLMGAREFALKVTEVEMGYNHADWLDPVIALSDGSIQRLGEMAEIHRVTYAPEFPFSFTYGGRNSADFLSSWNRTHTEKSSEDGRQRHDIVFADPQTGLEVTCELTVYTAAMAAEWVLYFENTGAMDTPILENIQALDLSLKTPVGEPPSLHTLLGSSASERDFLPVTYTVPPGAEQVLFPAAGLSSKGVPAGQPGGQMPFFNFAWEGGGLAGAIGWSGQWEMAVTRGAKARSPLEGQRPHGPEQERELRAFVMAERGRQPDLHYRLAAGQQTAHFTLHPSERNRSPRILLVPWEGAASIDGNNRLRRVLLEHYLVRRNGAVLVPPLSATAIQHGQDFTSTNAQNQLAAMEKMASIGVEAYWHDTAWFSGGFPDGIGNWTPDPERFPEGLKPLGDAAREHGMDFVLWFDVERVMPGTDTAREHPEWLLHTEESDALFNLGDPDALDWLADRLSKCIEDWGVTILRQDMTILPLPYWQDNDAEDRRGIHEIRHVENLYALWDRLLSRHPGLVIDNCAGGGCRIDLETMRRSIPLWRSDTQIFGRSNAAWNQAQTAGLNLFVPVHAAGLWSLDPYNARSTTTTGGATLLDINSDAFPMDAARRARDEVELLRPYWLGDYYPLTEIGMDERQWCGWQFHRPDLGGGYCLLFRRAESPYPAMEVALRGIDVAARYDVRDIDSGRKTHNGRRGAGRATRGHRRTWEKRLAGVLGTEVAPGAHALESQAKFHRDQEVQAWTFLLTVPEEQLRGRGAQDGVLVRSGEEIRVVAYQRDGVFIVGIRHLKGSIGFPDTPLRREGLHHAPNGRQQVQIGRGTLAERVEGPHLYVYVLVSGHRG